MHPTASPATMWIETLGLTRHPEGGWYRETFRSNDTLHTPKGPRQAMTLIHFALDAGEASAWHRVSSDEAWIWCEGEPLELTVVSADLARVERMRLGPTTRGCVPHHVVPAGAWQAARSTGNGSLVTCCVAPGFEFADFQLLGQLPNELAAFRRAFPKLVP
jgi:predicted cupin superfamily sugar epimerase